MAFCLDMLLIITVKGIVDYLTFSSDDQALLLKPERFLDIALGWLYFAGSEVCAWQATLGKYLAGLKVTGTNGRCLGFRETSIRYFAKPIAALALFMRFILGVSPISRRAFHDRLTRSAVVTR